MCDQTFYYFIVDCYTCYRTERISKLPLKYLKIWKAYTEMWL
jgi:hypothetical protein